MANFIIKPEDYVKVSSNCCEYNALKKEKFEEFNESILGIGDISEPSIRKESIAVIFDLESFTAFSSQPDPQLFLPEFLNTFLKWIFSCIRIKNKVPDLDFNEGYVLYSTLPYYSKFLGDGILFLFERNMDEEKLHNIFAQMWEITQAYKTHLLPRLERKYSNVPQRLRCGVALGDVYSIGGGKDYVGPCINTAARLQHFDPYTFAFSTKGINIEKIGKTSGLFYLLTDQEIRGIGVKQIIGVSKKELKDLKKSTPVESLESINKQYLNKEEKNNEKVVITSLSELEKLLIKTASSVENVNIIKIRVRDELRVEVNNITLFHSQNSREISEWEETFGTLGDKRLISKKGNHSYSLTPLAYKLGDMLNSEEASNLN